MKRIVRLYILLAFAFLLLGRCAFAQSAKVTGQVTDPQGGAVPGADVRIVNEGTNVERRIKTNESGFFVAPFLEPGKYKVFVQARGFDTVGSEELSLTVGQVFVFNVQLKVGGATEHVTVSAESQILNTSDATVGTVVDRSYIENMPLNGRSLQSLMLLTPGIVNASPQGVYGEGTVTGYSGEFSVNGQRTDANYYMVDGVSANVGTYRYGYGTEATSGSLPGNSALGTTQNLVSIDALQEFRVDTSSYSAEFGRMPGAQFSFVTRSGTNQWHGTASDYLRNTVFDANNWFNNYFGFANPGERQNDFGGTLGGPLVIPHVYDGKDKTFFFFSYEGMRLDQPSPAITSYVPDMALRQNSGLTPALSQILNSFPIPNGVDLGNGLAEFIGVGSLPNSIDSTSIRLDQTITPKLKVFFRFANTDSSSPIFGEGNDAFTFTQTTYFNTRTYTVGASSPLSNTTSNELRFNYTYQNGGSAQTPISFGGGKALDLASLSGIDAAGNNAYQTYLALYFGSHFAYTLQGFYKSPNSQWNITDTFSWVRGRHQLRFGIDYREVTPAVSGDGNPYLAWEYYGVSSLLANNADFGFVESDHPVYPVFVNTSIFAQDQWKVTSRLTLNGGLRWEINPAPGNRNHTAIYTLTGNDPSSLAVAPYGTALWQTSWYNIAPRLGAAYVLRTKPGWETVVRSGGGLFYDTGQSVVGTSLGSEQPGYGAYAEYGAGFGSTAAFPFTPAQVAIPVPDPPVAPYTNSFFYYYPRHLQLPYTLQWNASVQQSLGPAQALTVSYVGAHGAKLIGNDEISVSPFNPNFNYVDFVHNGLTSDYGALQVQFQRRLSRGLQVLASYAWSHCIDYTSTDLGTLYESQRGNCDSDLRNSLSGAFSYDVPTVFQGGFAKAALSHWGLDDRFTARGGFPITLQGNSYLDPATGKLVSGTLDVVPGQPLYLYGSNCTSILQSVGNLLSGQGCPGGKAINPLAFTTPPANTFGDQPRNSLRGLGAWQMDLAIRREFPLHERLRLQFRAEAFNIFNHPNFGTFNTTYCASGPGCTFGQVINTLNIGLGGLSPLFQLGGPRSMQFALKLIF